MSDTIILTKKNFVTMIPNIYEFLGQHSKVMLVPKDNKKVDMSWYDYIVSGNYKKQSENDGIIKNKIELTKYLDKLKR